MGARLAQQSKLTLLVEQLLDKQELEAFAEKCSK